MRYIVEKAEPWVGGWHAWAVVDGRPVTNEMWSETGCGAFAAAQREVARMDEAAVERAAKENRRG